MTDIFFNEIFPIVRYAQILTIPNSEKYGIMAAYDHRIFLCLEGTGSIDVDGCEYAMQKGTLLMWGASLPYQFNVSSNSPLSLIGFNFDFTRCAESENMPIPPEKLDAFDKLQITENVCITDAAFFNEPLYIRDMYELEKRFFEIRDEFVRQKRYFMKRCSALMAELLVIIARAAQGGAADMHKGKHIDEILSYIHENYNGELTNKLLGQIFCYHPNYINRLVVEATGMSAHQYIMNYRIARSIDLLQSDGASVSQACFACGFKDVAHFSKCFKAKTGRLPSDFLRR